jgi:hypothetical protein
MGEINFNPCVWIKQIHPKKDMATATTRQEGLDKFYTVPSVAKECISKVAEYFSWTSWDLIVEPSAGNGSFFLQIPSAKKIGFDIRPDHSEIQTQDFFNYKPPEQLQRVLVIGNPPFGKVSSLAVKFFNHAASFASVIAFIVPRTFRRVSIQNKLHLSFHLLYDQELPLEPCAFSPPMMAKCCFQIWEKQSSHRSLINLPLTHPHWTFLPYGPQDKDGQPTPPKNADFAVRAYGGRCGEIRTSSLNQLRPKSWHWIQCHLSKDILVKRFASLDYSISQETARQNSIGRAELIALYSSKYDAS